MKKILLTVAAAAVALMMLSACSGNSADFEFTNESLKAVSADKEVEFSYNSRVTVTEGALEACAFGGGDKTASEGAFAINGVSVGDEYKDFAQAFGFGKGQAMWETCLRIDEDEVLFDYTPYANKKIAFESYDDAFLTVGYCTFASEGEKAQWQIMAFDYLEKVWSLELQEYQKEQIGDICLISAGFDEMGKINMLDVYYGSYEAFEENEDYTVNIDYFAQAENEAAVEE